MASANTETIPHTIADTKFFDSFEDLDNLPPHDWVVEGVCQHGEVTMLAALSGESKTWTALSIVRALLTGELWLNHFPVKKSKRVVYLVPEVGRRQIAPRPKKMGLMPFIQEGRLLIRTLNMGRTPKLTDPHFA